MSSWLSAARLPKPCCSVCGRGCRSAEGLCYSCRARPRQRRRCWVCSETLITRGKVCDACRAARAHQGRRGRETRVQVPPDYQDAHAERIAVYTERAQCCVPLFTSSRGVEP